MSRHSILSTATFLSSYFNTNTLSLRLTNSPNALKIRLFYMVLDCCCTERLEEKERHETTSRNHSRQPMNLQQGTGCRNGLDTFVEQQRTSPFKSCEPCSVTQYEAAKEYVKEGTMSLIHLQLIGSVWRSVSRNKIPKCSSKEICFRFLAELCNQHWITSSIYILWCLHRMFKSMHWDLFK